MTETITSGMISRRGALSFLGLAALSVAAPTVLMGSDAEAQPAGVPSGTDAPSGTERRQARRTRRTERRQARRTRRTERRQARREGRMTRRRIRREGRESR
jgi:hypothetical protein